MYFDAVLERLFRISDVPADLKSGFLPEDRRISWHTKKVRPCWGSQTGWRPLS